MVSSQIERELKFAVPASFRMPDLSATLGPAAEVRTSVVHLTSTYFDAADHPLLAHHITLRRREGDTDTGWHLKLPAGNARTEERLPLEAGTTHVPPQLAERVAGLTAGHALQPVATIRTERHILGVYRGDALLVEVADDHVTGISMGDIARTTQWREVEAELAGGTEKELTKIKDRLVSAGASMSPSASKLAQTLQSEPAQEDVTTSAGRLVAAYVDAQVLALGLGDVDLRRGFDDVHKIRVAARRLRSTLRVFGAALDPATTAQLDAELSWYQDLLGTVRDPQVQRDRLAASIAALPDDLVLGPVSAQVEQVLHGEQVKALAAVRAALDSPRYRDLLAAVRAWAEHPLDSTDAAIADPSPADLRRLARKARRTAGKRLAAALAADDPQLLHRARKAAKRARYATELVAAGGGHRRADRASISAYKRLQEVLGEHQDSVLAAANLRRIGSAAGVKRGHNGFTYGVLYEREQARTAAARARARDFDA